MAEIKDLFKINRQSRLPLYDLIEQNFRELILNGELASGDPVPSEWELSDLYGVSRLTVRHALDNLARQGWLNRRHGVGTFVSKPNVAQIAPSKLSFTEQMRAIGRIPSSRQIYIHFVPASAQVAASLELQADDQVIEILRVRLADGEPILLETSYLSRRSFPDFEGDTDLTNASLYEFLNSHYQISVATMDQTLEPVLLTESQARYLETHAGTPALYSEVIAFDPHGDPIEFSWSVTRGDQCKFFFRFRRGECA
jgi:GntR family transcriptional regulator